MNQEETVKLLTIIQRCYPNHFKEFDADAFKIQCTMWQRVFADCTFAECFTAFEMWFASEQFPPMPVNLNQIVKKMRNPNAFITPEVAWETVSNAVRRFGWINQQKAFATFSESTKRAVQNIGGWQKICETPLGQQWDFMRKNFMDAYQDFEGDNQEQVLLPTKVLKKIQNMMEQPKNELSKM